MFVGSRMTRDPVTVSQRDLLSEAAARMQSGGFRRLPVVEDGQVVGILCESDLRPHAGVLEHTRVNGAMTEDPVTVSPLTLLEDAAELLLSRKIGGLPVVDNDRLVGILTVSDFLSAFVEMLAGDAASTRIDLRIDDGNSLAEAARLAEKAGGEVLSVGRSGESRVIHHLRVRSADPDRVAQCLLDHGYAVVGVHGTPASSFAKGAVAS